MPRYGRKDKIAGQFRELLMKLGGTIMVELDRKGTPDCIIGLPGLTLTGTVAGIEEAVVAIENIEGVVINVGANILVELKSGDKAKLTPDQVAWWGGPWAGPRKIIRHLRELTLLARGE